MRRRALVIVALILTSCGAHDRAPGEPCDSDADCVADSSCAAVDVRDGVARYECVAHCDPPAVPYYPSRCEGGGVCWSVSTATPDVYGCFLGNDIPIGHTCEYTLSCVRGSTCQEWAEGSFCTPVCDLYGCGPMEPCSQPYDCESGLLCATIGTSGTLADGACIAECATPSGGVGLCDDGSTCADFHYSDGTVVYGCIPGGATPVGESCSYSVECERGALCVDDGPTGVCRQACNSSADCPSGAACDGGTCSP